MFNAGGLSFITDFVDANIVNIVYRNNDIINILIDLFLKIGEQLGIDTTNGLSTVFLKLYFGTILLYIIIHAVTNGSRLYSKFFGVFSNDQKLTTKSFFGSELVQIFLLTILATILLMPAKMQYVQLQPYIPSGTVLPQYSDLEDTHPKGKVINTISVVAWTMWLHSRFIYGIQTSNGPVPANTEIAPFSINRMMPNIFHKYFTEINTAIDGYIYVYNFINALKEINQLEKQEFEKYASILDSQLSITMGIQAKFKAKPEYLKKYTSEYKNIYDHNNPTFAEHLGLLALISNVEGNEVWEAFNNWSASDFTEKLGMVGAFVTRLVLSPFIAISNGVNLVTGHYAESLINRQLMKFDSVDSRGLPLLESHVDFLNKGHKNNTYYKKMINDYITHTITGDPSTLLPNDPDNPDNCTAGTTECLYIDNLKLANKYLLKDTFSRLLNIIASPDHELIETYPILENAPEVDVEGTSNTDLTTYAKIYFDEALAKNQARLLTKITNLKAEDYPFHKGIKSIFLLSHTNFLDDMAQKHINNDVGITLSNLGVSYVPSADLNAANKLYATSMLKHSLLTKDSVSDNANISELTYNGAYNVSKKNNELKDIALYSANDGLNITAFLNQEVDSISKKKAVLSGTITQTQDNYNQVDSNFNFVGTDISNPSDEININFDDVVKEGVIQNGAYNFFDNRISTIFGESLQYVTDVYKKFNPISNFLTPITEQILFEYLFTNKGKLYNDILNYKSGGTTQEIIKSHGLTFNCETVTNSDICDYLVAPNIDNFTTPIGTKAYLEYSGSKIEQEIQKLNYILEAMQASKVPSNKNEAKLFVVRKALDVKLIKKYLNVLKYFQKKGDTNQITVTNNDEIFELFRLANYIGKYIEETSSVQNPVSHTINGMPLELLHNLYFYPHALAYFENEKSTNTKVNPLSVESTIRNLYNFLSPTSIDSFSRVFGKYEQVPGTYEMKLLRQTDFQLGNTPADINANIGKAKINFYSNLKLMTDLQNGDLQIESKESPNIENGELTESSIQAFTSSAEKYSFANVSTEAIKYLSGEMFDLLTWVTANFADMFAEKILKFVIEPYHFIFGKNDFTEIGQSTLTQSAIKGIFETSNNFHMDFIKLNYQVPSSKNLLENAISAIQKYEEEIGGAIITIVSLPLAPAGLAGGALVAMAKVIKMASGFNKVARAVSKVKNAVRVAKIRKGRKGKLLKKKRGKHYGSKFSKKNLFGKGWSVISFLVSAPFAIVSAILGAIIKTMYMFVIVISLIAGIYSFLIQFVMKIAMPLAVGTIAIIYHILFFPVIYMAKDIMNGFSGSFENLNSTYTEGLTSISKKLFVTYIYYILVVMMFILIYQIAMGIAISVSNRLMFEWHTFNLPISMVVLFTFWISTQLMSLIIRTFIPESMMAKFNHSSN